MGFRVLGWEFRVQGCLGLRGFMGLRVLEFKV